MKLVVCDGRELAVYDVSDEPVYRLAAVRCPIKAHGWRLLEEEAARELVRELARMQAGDAAPM